jgi:hypothetical protein
MDGDHVEVVRLGFVREEGALAQEHAHAVEHTLRHGRVVEPDLPVVVVAVEAGVLGAEVGQERLEVRRVPDARRALVLVSPRVLLVAGAAGLEGGGGGRFLARDGKGLGVRGA